MMHKARLNLHFPITYSGDGFLGGIVIKTIIDTGWYLTNPFLSAPFIYNIADFPFIEDTNFLIIKALTLFSNHYAVIQNMFFILTFPLITLCSVYAFRTWGLNRISTISASLLFTFLPYHTMRGVNHLFLSAYYAIPIYAVFIYILVQPTNKKWHWWQWLCALIALVLAASSGVYYAYFGCFFLLLSGLIATINYKNRKPILLAIGFVAVMCATVILNALPTIIYHKSLGPNTEVAHRHGRESELYGLKIIQMLLPGPDYRIKAINDIREKYNQTGFLVNENVSASLGVIGSIGFLLLIMQIFIRIPLEDKNSENAFFYLSRLSLGAILLGTIGGFGTIIAYFVLPAIRCYNRISIFIDFFGLCAFFIFMQRYLRKWFWRTNPELCGFFIILITLLGLIDQINFHPGHTDYENMQLAFANDQSFVKQLENILPPESLIFQLPVVPFPENPPVYNLEDYASFRGYLHSKTLHWSCGAMKGRYALTWQTEVSKQPVKTMIQSLIKAGFSGIYIDRRGFPDNKPEIETELTKVLHYGPSLISDNKMLVFYNFRMYNDAHRS